MLSGCQTPVNRKPPLSDDLEVINDLRNLLIYQLDIADAVKNKTLMSLLFSK